MRFLVLLVLDVDLAEEAESGKWLIVGREKVISKKLELANLMLVESVTRTKPETFTEETRDTDEPVFSEKNTQDKR